MRFQSTLGKTWVVSFTVVVGTRNLCTELILYGNRVAASWPSVEKVEVKRLASTTVRRIMFLGESKGCGNLDWWYERYTDIQTEPLHDGIMIWMSIRAQTNSCSFLLVEKITMKCRVRKNRTYHVVNRFFEIYNDGGWSESYLVIYTLRL